jgi:CBS domain-containing protein
MKMKWKSKAKWKPVTIKENMSPNVASVDPEVSAKYIATVLRDKKIGCVPVVESGHLVGMITDRDITIRTVAEGRDTDSTIARDIMSEPVNVCHEDDLLADAAQVMEENQVRRLPVLDRDEHLVGILTADDLAWHTDHRLLGDVIQSVYERHD